MDNKYFKYNWYKSNDMNLFNPKEGYLKGNMFSNLYNEYKNYSPATLRPRNERENKLYELLAMCFAAHELNLYLDLHPEDNSMLTLFNDYQTKANKLQKEYESLYGPIAVEDVNSNKNTFAWEQDSWPWEGYNV